jgi:DNA-binding MarR family transcriptional regulator
MSDDETERRKLLERIDVLTLAITVRSIPMALEPLLSTELTIQQLKTLSVVVTTEDGVAGTRLAASFGVSLASMSKLLDRLTAHGLVIRATDDGDQRVRRVHATELGRAVVQRMMAARPELGAEVLARLSTAELRALETGIHAINRELRGLRN